MTLLEMIWWTSGGLATLSVATMAGLILRRLYQNHAERRLQERRKALTLLVMIYLDAPSDPNRLRELCRGFDLNILQRVASSLVEGRRASARLRTDLSLLREIGQDLLGSVRGGSRERIISLLRETPAREICFADLDHPHPATRIAAIETLSLLPDAEVAAALRDRLSDREPEVRLAAARALVEMGPYLTVDDLVEKLDIGVTIRSRALRDIFRIFADHNAPDLIRLLDSDPSDLVAALAIYGLGTTQDYSVIPAIARYASQPSVDIRAETMRAFAAIGHPDAEPAVLRALADPAWEVRTEAAICAGRLSLPSAIPLLRERLADQEWWPRFRAAEALNAIGDPGKTVLQNMRRGLGRAARISEMVLAERNVAA